MWARSFKLLVFQVSCYKSVKWSGTLNGAGKLNAWHLLRRVYFIGDSYKSSVTNLFYCLFLKLWNKSCIFASIFVSQKLETVFSVKAMNQNVCAHINLLQQYKYRDLVIKFGSIRIRHKQCTFSSSVVCISHTTEVTRANHTVLRLISSSNP